LFLIKRSGGSTPPPGTNARAGAPLAAYFKWSLLMVALTAGLGLLLARLLHAFGWD
jgi:hypothetical protein